VKKHNRISGAWAARSIEMMESPAYRILSLSAHRALSRLEIEFAHHGGQDNGKLPVTFDDLADYGIHRTAIGPALAELESLGFIKITEHGKMAHAAEYRRPNKFLLMSRPPQKGIEARDEWRRFKTLEEAEAEAAAARNRGVNGKCEKKKPPVRKPYQKLVRKPYHKGQIASTETVPLRMSETVPLSISREASQPNGVGLTLETDAPPKLEWTNPVVTELRWEPLPALAGLGGRCAACAADMGSRAHRGRYCSDTCRWRAQFWRHRARR